MLPAARHLTPDPLSPSWRPVIDYMLVCVPWSCRERERDKTRYLGNVPKKHS